MDDATHVPERTIPIPAFLSPVARSYLLPQPARAPYPPTDDKEGWRGFVAATDQAVLPLLRQISAQSTARVEERDADGVRVYDILPPDMDPADRGIVMEMHGGALVFCGGGSCRIMGTGSATRFRRRMWSIDYRMPSDHPYPAGLDDYIAAYRALLRERSPRRDRRERRFGRRQPRRRAAAPRA